MSNLKQIGLALHMYSNDNAEAFPTAAAGANGMESLGQLYSSYISDRKVFRCASDTGVTELTNLQLTAGTATVANTGFTAARCSYGYDDRHTAVDDPGVAIAADAKGLGVTLSDNHAQKGQNVLYIDGHVEWKGTSTCGYYNGTSYDAIYTDNLATLGTATDTYIDN